MVRTKQSAEVVLKRNNIRVKNNLKTPVAKKRLAPSVDGQTKARRRFKPGTVSLREIRRAQQSVGHQLPYAPFVRLVREIAQTYKHDARFEKSAIEGLMVAAESHVTQVFQRANGICVVNHVPSAQERKGGAANPTLRTSHMRLASVWVREAVDGLDDSGPIEFRDRNAPPPTVTTRPKKKKKTSAAPLGVRASNEPDTAEPAEGVETAKPAGSEQHDSEDDVFIGSDN
jgi:histone H3